MNNMTTNTAFEVKVRGATRSLIGERKMHMGDWSNTHAVYLQPGCEKMQHFQQPGSGMKSDRIILLNLEEHLGMIVGVICGSLGLLSLLFAALICRS